MSRPQKLLEALERWDELGRRILAVSPDLFESACRWIETIVDMAERRACPLEVRSELARALRGSNMFLARAENIPPQQNESKPAVVPVAAVAVKRGRRRRP